jgi:hypothetical protein
VSYSYVGTPSLGGFKLYLNISKLQNKLVKILFISNFVFSKPVYHNFIYSYFPRELEYSF